MKAFSVFELVSDAASNRPRYYFLTARSFFRCAQPGNEGAVAQLGERLICIQEVAGSIPTSSTMLE